MGYLRLLAVFGLCVFLALTSVTLAVARGAAQPAGLMLLCLDGAERTVPVDAQGQPTTTSHVCPDCLLALCVDIPPGPSATHRPASATAWRPFADAGPPIPPARPAMLARAPPRPV